MRASSSISEPSYFILAALLDGPLHGYGIIKKAAKLSDGRVRLAAVVGEAVVAARAPLYDLLAVGALDPRPAIAAAVYLVPGLLYAAESMAGGAPSTLALGYWAVLAALMVALAAVAWRIRRQQLTQR